MSNYNKKKSIGRTIALALCGVLTVAAVAGAGTALYMGAKNNGWFDSEDDTEIVGEEATATGVVVNEGTNNGIKLTSAAITPSGTTSTFSGTTYSITAEVYPENATDKTVTWSISDNASGYVTLSANDLTATVTVSAAFPEQITVTCTSNANAGVYGTVTLDYAKRITAMTGNFFLIYGDSYLTTFTESGMNKISYDELVLGYPSSISPDYYLNPTITEGVGTLSDTFTYERTLSVDSSLIAYAEDYGITGMEANTITVSSYTTLGTDLLKSLYGSTVFDGGTNQALLYELLTATAENVQYQVPHFIYTVKATGTYSSYTATYKVYFDTTCIDNFVYVAATSLSTSVSSLIF